MGSTHHLDTHTVVGSHYFRKFFIDAGYDVVFLSAPITFFHFLSIMNSDTRLRIKKAFSKLSNEVIPLSIVAPHHIFPFNSNLIINAWAKVSNLQKTDCEILYIDNLFYHNLIDLVKYENFIFRIPDKFEAFPGWDDKLEVQLLKLINKADLIVVSSKIYCEELQEKYKGRNFVHIPNGIDLRRFRGGNKKSIDSKFDINFVYLGAMDKWFDVDLLVKLAKSFPKQGFYLIGDERGIESAISSEENIVALGKVPHHEVVDLLGAFDIGLILFDRDKFPELIKYINPLKLYEYSIVGLPTISTYWEELERISSPAVLAHDFIDFKIAVGKCLKELPTSQNKQEKIRSFATSYSWDKILSQSFMPALNSIINSKTSDVAS